MTPDQEHQAPTRPFSNSDFVGIACVAHSASVAADVAYWMASASNEDYVGHHISSLVAHVDELTKRIAELRATHPYFAESNPHV